MKNISSALLGIIVIVLLAAGGTYYLINKYTDKKTDKTSSTTIINQTTTNKDTTGTASTNCGLTKAATEGPYYISGTAELKDGNLNTTNLPGTPVRISGHVYAGADGTAPIKATKIEIWEADSTGVYHPNTSGNIGDYTTDKIALRGFVQSNDKGEYSFTALYPGYYENRARHIQVRATAEGYAPITTQLIFYPKTGDVTTYNTDSIAKSLPSCNLIKLDETVTPNTGTYDFRLIAG